MVYTQWKYRVKIGVNNPVNIADYQINVIIPYRVHMNSNFSDIRFSDVNGNELSYWIESYISLVSANIYIKCPNNCYEFYLYYGNSTATTTSNGTTTFLQWHGVATTTYLDSLIISPTQAMVYESKFRITVATSSNIMHGLADTTTYGTGDISQIAGDGDDIYHVVRNEGVASYKQSAPGFTLNTWYKGKIVFDGINSDGYIDDVHIGTGSITTNLPNENMGLVFYMYTGSGEMQYSFVRAYTLIEPIATIYQTNINPFHRRFNSLLIYTYTKLYSIDTLIKALNIDRNYNLDTLIKLLNIDRNYVINTLFKKLDIDNNYSIDLLISNLGIDKNYVIDILFKKLNIDRNYNLDTLIKLLNIDRNYVINTLFKKLDIDNNYSIDLLISNLGIDKNYVIDILFKKLNIDRNYNSDTLIKALNIDTNYVINILIKKLDINKTYSVDTLIKLLDIDKNYVIDGIFVQIVTFKPTASGRQIKPTASGRQIKPTASGREQ